MPLMLKYAVPASPSTATARYTHTAPFMRRVMCPDSQVSRHAIRATVETKEVGFVPALVWMAVALVAVGIEVFTVDLTFGLIAVGAATAGVAGLLGAPLWLQVVVGGAVSVAGIAFVRPIALRHLKQSSPQTRTGVDALPGATGRALSEITKHDGRITLRGEIWSARLDLDVTSEPVPDGTEVVVTRIDGATALVYPIDPR